MLVRDNIIVNGTLAVKTMNNAVSNNYTALFHNTTSGVIEKRLVGSIIDKDANSFLTTISYQIPSIFVAGANITPLNNKVNFTLASQSKGMVFATNPNTNGVPSFMTLTSGHLTDAGVMFTSHPANSITQTNIDFWNSIGGYLKLTGGTMVGKLNTMASKTTSSGFNIAHGVAPTSPVDGDIWTTAGGVFARVNGATQLLSASNSWEEIPENEIADGSTFANLRFITGRRLKFAFEQLTASKARRLVNGAKINNVNFDGTTDITISATPLNHTHLITDVTGLQSALDGKQPLNANLTAISSLSSGTGLLKRNTNGTWVLDTNTYLTQELDKKGVGSFSVSGTTSKTLTLTLRDNTTQKVVLQEVTEAELNGNGSSDAKLISANTIRGFITNQLSSTMTYKGQVLNYNQLPTIGNKIGDVWNIVNANTNPQITAGDNVAWNGTSWDVLSGYIDISNLVHVTQKLILTGDVTANSPLISPVPTTISNNAITTPKILDGAVTSAKLANMHPSQASYNKVTVNTKGLVVSGTTEPYLVYADLPQYLPNAYPFVMTFDGGAVDGTSRYQYNGDSTTKVNIRAGTNVNLVKTNGEITINAVTQTTNMTGVAPISISQNVVSHLSGNGYNHLPSHGQEFEYVKWGGSGTGKWESFKILKYGAGLRGGNGNTQTNGFYDPSSEGVISVIFGDTHGTAVEGNDPRLENIQTSLNSSIVGVSVSGTTTKTIMLERLVGDVLTASWEDLNTTYSTATTAELASASSTTARLISGQRLNEWATNKGFLTSYTETDPKGVASIAVSGSTTKMLTIKLRDGSVHTTSWADNDTIYTLPLATSTALGGVKVGFPSAVTNGALVNLGVQLSDEKAFVQLTKAHVSGVLGFMPVGTDTTYTTATTAELASASSTTARLISGQRLNEWATNKGFITATDIPYMFSDDVFVTNAMITSNNLVITTTKPIHNNSAMVFLNGVKIPKKKILITNNNTITINNTSVLTPIIATDYIEIEYLTI